MIDIFITYNSESQIEKVKEIKGSSLTFHFINSIKDKRKARMLKSHWGANADPFILITDNNTPVKAFYTEAGDSIQSLIQYMYGKTD